MRLFIAIPLSDEVEREIIFLQEQLPAGVRTAAAPHLTLKFLGDCDATIVEVVRKSLQGMRFTPFSLALESIGAFPNWQRPNVIWVGCQESKAVQELQFAIANRLKGIGKPDDHPFHPHFTLARVAAALPEADVAQIRSISVRRKSFTVDRFALYESTLTREGPVYREIATYG